MPQFIVSVPGTFTSTKIEAPNADEVWRVLLGDLGLSYPPDGTSVSEVLELPFEPAEPVEPVEPEQSKKTTR